MLLLLLYPKHVIKLSGYNLGCYKNSHVTLSGGAVLVRKPTTGKPHPILMRSHTLNSPPVCNAFVATFSQFFRANFPPWKAHYLSSRENLWVGILRFSLWLVAEEQLLLVALLFAMLKLFAGGYP